MADKYWVSNGGNWDDTNHWSNVSGGVGGNGAPGSGDNAIFDANSFTLTSQIIVIRNGFTNQCAGLNMTGVTNSPNLQFKSTSGVGVSATLTTNGGNVTIPIGVTISFSTLGANCFLSVKGGNLDIDATFPFAPPTPVAALSIEINSGTVGLLKPVTVEILTVLDGATFNTNNLNIICGVINISGNSSNATFNAGSSVITFIFSNQVVSGINAAQTFSKFNRGTSTLFYNSSVLNGILNIVNFSTGSPTNLVHKLINNSAELKILPKNTIDDDFTIGPGSVTKFQTQSSSLTKVNGHIISNATSGNHAIFTWINTGENARLNSPNFGVNIAYVDVDHNIASGITPFVSTGINNGNNTNWQFNTNTQQTQTGKARIHATTNRTQTGKANILDPNSIPEVVALSDTTYTTTKVQLNIPNLDFDETGIVYATHPNPTIADSFVVAVKVIGPQFIEITGLTPCLTYYFRTYILRSGVYSYGVETSLVMPCISSILFPITTDNLIGPYEIEILAADNKIKANLTGSATDLIFSLIRNRPEEISLSVPLITLKELAANLHESVPNLLQTGIQTIRIKRKGVIICAGQLDYWEVDFTDPTKPIVKVKAHGWLSLLGYRIFSGEYTTKDANFIIRDMITQTQALGNGDFGMTLGASASGTNSYANKKFENKNIKEAIIEFTEEDSGPDIQFTWDKVLNIYHPGMGTARNDIVFTMPGNTINIGISSDSTRIVNSLLARGKGYGDVNVNTTIDDATSKTTYKLRNSVKDYPDLDIDPLTKAAQGEVAFFKDPLVLHTIKYSGHEPSCPEIGTFGLGDRVRVAVYALPLLSDQLNNVFTIDKITVTLKDNGEEIIELEVNNSQSLS